VFSSLQGFPRLGPLPSRPRYPYKAQLLERCLHCCWAGSGRLARARLSAVGRHAAAAPQTLRRPKLRRRYANRRPAPSASVLINLHFFFCSSLFLGREAATQIFSFVGSVLSLKRSLVPSNSQATQHLSTHTETTKIVAQSSSLILKCSSLLSDMVARAVLHFILSFFEAFGATHEPKTLVFNF